MPRLDNSNYEVIEVYNLNFDENDPGRTPPVDLCAYCWRDWVDDNLEIEHPPYTDSEYRCFECDERLTGNDDAY